MEYFDLLHMQCQIFQDHGTETVTGEGKVKFKTFETKQFTFRRPSLPLPGVAVC